jgi:hypothetical protein
MSQQQIENEVLGLVAKMDLQRATFLLAKIADQLFARNAMPAAGAAPIGFISVSKGETAVIAGGGSQAVPLRAFCPKHGGTDESLNADQSDGGI